MSESNNSSRRDFTKGVAVGDQDAGMAAAQRLGDRPAEAARTPRAMVLLHGVSGGAPGCPPNPWISNGG